MSTASAIVLDGFRDPAQNRFVLSLVASHYICRLEGKIMLITVQDYQGLFFYFFDNIKAYVM